MVNADPESVLVLVVLYRTNLTHAQAATTIGSTAGRAAQRPTPALAEPLGPPPTDRRDVLVVDGTLAPIRDRSNMGKSKNYRRSENGQVAARSRGGRVRTIGDGWP